jgi:hypothetical protein
LSNACTLRPNLKSAAATRHIREAWVHWKGLGSDGE